MNASRATDTMECTLCGSVERCEACTEVNEIDASLETQVRGHVGHSLANDTWFVRFYPFASEAAAKAFESSVLFPAVQS